MTRAARPIAGVAAAGTAILAFAGTATAHEEYVVDERAAVGLREFYAEALADPAVVGPLFAGGVAVLAAVALYLAFRPVPRDVAAFRTAMREYTEFVPWLLRISLGIPLIGAGFAGYFLSPAVEVQARVLQVALGFLLLFGLATRFAALAALAVYLLGAVVWPTVLLQFEFVGGLLAVALLGSGQPSADHVLQQLAGGRGTLYGRVDVVYDRARAFQAWIDPYVRFVPTVVRVGLGVTFVVLGVTQKLLQPDLALAVVDRYDLTAVVPVDPALWVMGAGLAETALGVALILGAFTRASAAVAIVMFSLTLFALPDDPVLAHVALFGMASALLITGSGPYAVDNWTETVESTLEDATPAASN